jgi:hypothetical protein
MYFRGSSYQGQSLTPCSTAKFTNFQFWRHDEVGKFIYQKPAGDDFDVARNQMELKIQISPDKVISDVEWAIKREISRARWGPGSGPLGPPEWPDVKGATGWAPDHPTADETDLEQNPDCTDIFCIDGPGYGNDAGGLPYTADYRYTHKAKFQQWVEVEIAGKWYVCSPYKDWRSIMHVKYKDATDGWVYDASKTNEIVVGTITGFAGSWSED